MKQRRIKAAEGRLPHPHATVKHQAFNGAMLKGSTADVKLAVRRGFSGPKIVDQIQNGKNKKETF